MNNKHKKTLAAVFRNPVSGTLDWADIEALLIAVGAEVVEGSGSRVRFVKDGFILYIHRHTQVKKPRNTTFEMPARS